MSYLKGEKMKNLISFKWSLVLLVLLLPILVSACATTEEPATEVQPTAAEEMAEEAEEAAQPTEAPAEEEAMEEEAAEDCTVFFFAPWELSGAGATVGNNNKDAATLAIEEINAEGGLLGCQIEVEWADTQSDPATSKALIAKGLEKHPYAILGPAYSGSIIVNMVEAERAETVQIMGGEAANLTEQGNPYIFRTSFGQATSMPKIATYMASEGYKAVDVIYVNNDFGKGGRDAIVAQLEERGIEILNDISTEEQQADFAPEVLTVKGSEADALFVYLNEEESARLLVELKKQGFAKPIIGETTIIGQNVIDLAGDAANGAKGHVGLTASAPLPLIEEYRQKFEEKYGRIPDHNGMKGYIGVYAVKAVTERIGEFDSKKLAEAMHCTIITTEEEPGVLLDLVYDENGDVDRESFLVEVVDGVQVVTEVLPRVGGSCGEP
jgi:branched-chain amino acid transport system substrate-binding protein